MFESIVLFDPYNNPVMWAHLLTPVFNDEEKCSFERLPDDFSQEGKLFLDTKSYFSLLYDFPVLWSHWFAFKVF